MTNVRSNTLCLLALLSGCGDGETGILVSVHGAGVSKLEIHIGRDDNGKWRQDPTLKKVPIDLEGRDISSRPFNLLVVPGQAGLDQSLTIAALGLTADGKLVSSGGNPARGLPGLRFTAGKIYGVDVELAPAVAPLGPLATDDGCFCPDRLPWMSVGGAPQCDPRVPSGPAQQEPLPTCDGYQSSDEASTGRLVPCFALAGDVCLGGTRTCADESRVAFEDGCDVSDTSLAAPDGTFCKAYAAASQACADPMVVLWMAAAKQDGIALDPCDPNGTLPGKFAALPFGFDLAGMKDAVYLEDAVGQPAVVATAPIRLHVRQQQQVMPVMVPLLIDDHKVLVSVNTLAGCPGRPDLSMPTGQDIGISPTDGGVVSSMDMRVAQDLAPASPDLLLPQPNFRNETNHMIGSSVNAVAIGDLDGDKFGDVLVGTTMGAGTLKSGVNGLLAPVGLNVGVGSYNAVAIGHLDNNGFPEVVVSNSGASKIYVFANAGNVLAAPVTFASTGGNTWFVSIADITGDGLNDLLFANNSQQGNPATMIINKGGFQFGTPFGVGGPVAPSSIAVADFDGSGKLDAVFGQGGQSITELTNDGIGNLVNPTAILTNVEPRSVASADLNADGAPDLVVCNSGSANVQILLNDRNGGFKLAATLPLDQPRGVAIADFNADKFLDLAVIAEAKNIAQLYVGHGDGSFDAAQALATGGLPHGIATGDLNNDARPDLVIGNFNGASLTVYLGN